MQALVQPLKFLVAPHEIGSCRQLLEVFRRKRCELIGAREGHVRFAPRTPPIAGPALFRVIDVH